MNAPTTAAPPPRRRRFRRYVWFALALFAAALYLGRDFLLPQVSGFLDVSEPPHAVDYVMVLGGGDDTRPFVAAAIYGAGLTKGVIVPSVERAPDVEDGLYPPEEVVIRRALHHEGVPDAAIIVLDGLVGSTRAEAEALNLFLDAHPDASVGVVTTHYHTRRARLLFQRTLGERAARVCFFAAPLDGYTPENWWHFSYGVASYSEEYLKLLLYRLGY